jgi:hypothetical protein
MSGLVLVLSAERFAADLTAVADGYRAYRGFKTVREMEYKVADGDDPQYNFKTWFMIREPLPLPATEPDSNSVEVNAKD